MFHSNTIDESLYSEMMEQIKRLNTDCARSQRRAGMKRAAKKTWDSFAGGGLSAAVRYLTPKVKWGIRQMRNTNPNRNKPSESDYFSSDRVAVYTVITGDYDELLEPYLRPDNCDFFAFTDRKFDDSSSTWTWMEIPDTLRGFSDPEKNRYLKMHPHELFDQYKYSVYVDGNVQIFTDMTEYINKLGPSGIGIHLHPSRNCVYEEMKEVENRGMETQKNIERHLSYMKETGMPENYGLLECTVIAREHHNSTCIKIMEEWWREYSEYSNRDQISLPHVLFRNGIKVQEVGVLGNNVRENPSFRIFEHTQKNKKSGSAEDG